MYRQGSSIKSSSIGLAAGDISNDCNVNPISNDSFDFCQAKLFQNVMSKFNVNEDGDKVVKVNAKMFSKVKLGLRR
jgi:hypothetical protein